jgi:hypothetical protein
VGVGAFFRAGSELWRFPFLPYLIQDLIRTCKERGEKREEEHTVSWFLDNFTYIEHDDGSVQFNQLRWKNSILHTE